MSSALQAKYVASRPPMQKATDYLNSRFPFQKATSEYEVFERVAAIMAPGEYMEAPVAYAQYLVNHTLPPYMLHWVELADQDILHRPITEK